MSTQLPPEVSKLVEKLKSKLWRMNNLYHIKDKEGKEVVMKLNPAQQKVVLDFRHNKKIILKSRQQGISTLYLLYYLDSCIFTPGIETGVQSYGKNESKKLARRAKLAWDRLPDVIKRAFNVRLEKYNADELVFSNGSTLKIGNFRGDTLQSLHVSELGKIAKKYPEKAKELKAGAFQAVSKNSKITIESTAEGKSGLFYEMWLKAMRHTGEFGPFDFQPIFLSWVHDPDCLIDVEKYIDDEKAKYFDWVEEQVGCVLTSQQKWWYVSKEEELTDMMKQEYPTTWEEAFEQSVEGTIYRKEFDHLIKHERIQSNLVTEGYPTYVSYDLGVNDKTVLQFCQIINGTPRLVYTYANKGENIEFYVKIMQSLKQFKIIQVLLPHDANVQELIAGRTRLEEFRRLGVPARLLKRVSVKDGINATRQLLKVLYIDKDHCDDTVEAIQMYRWKYDQRVGVYLMTPEHDDSSNYMDSLKYLALGIHYNKTSKEVIDKVKANKLASKAPILDGFAI